MKARTREEINQTERDYWNQNKLDRTKIKKLRRHAFFYSYKRERKIINKLLLEFDDKDVLEIGSYTWAAWFDKSTKPKSLTCINISEQELENGKKHASSRDFPINHYLMDANDLSFADESFDIVFGGAILHHLDIEKSISHIHRVLKPGGKIIFLEPLNMNPIYKIYRKMNPQERTPDEHALVSKDIKIIKEKFTFDHYFFDFFTVMFGVVSLKVYGDKNYDNWINKLASNLDIFISKIPFFYVLFARVILYGNKK
ncbi:class I SAM-dependent methyltransferase [Zunongwangia endophytica]|uniref:Class I SAM-dependent methyltransferase n=1 Tax=Zunongwangia endophytica TaxID=1808945 RepID=A0ABV8H8A9_9FLAO|nr:class I SAM-dependent methyltransferase [Zunongwangia endophytica]MDN3595046.1 class I SAM-dependent methyltransferase [Zunongwangia endophytica]